MNLNTISGAGVALDFQKLTYKIRTLSMLKRFSIINICNWLA